MFDGFVLKNHVAIIYNIFSFLNYWAGLYDDGDALKIKKGAEQLMKKVRHMSQDISGSDMSATTPSVSNILAIQAP
jgi:hypothetical protein